MFSRYNISITRFSNTVTKFVLYKDDQDLYNKLCSLSKGDRNTVLIPTNDMLVEFIHDHFDQLNLLYYLSTAAPEVLEICSNKKNTYNKANELNVPIPFSMFPENEEEVKKLAQNISYPVIIKPAVMFRLYKATGEKVFKCLNEEELIINYKKILKYIPQEEIIIQEIIKGGTKVLFSYGSFFAQGISYGNFITKRIRQKPMDFGISTSFAKTVLNKEIQNLAENFLKGINYFGLSEIEFMYDERTKEFKLLEINPRTWKWHSIANQLNINLFEMLINYFEGKENKIINNNLENIGWVERLTDTYVVLTEILKGQMSLKEYFKTMRYKKEYACWSWKDPLPAIMYLLLLPYLYFKRY